MGNRSFVMVSIGSAVSEKIRSLPGDRERFAYFCVLSSELSSFIGLFRYPPKILAFDLGDDVTIAEASHVISELDAAELIQSDPKSGYLRIVDWYAGPNRVKKNASHAEGIIKDYSRERDTAKKLRLGSISEFAISAVEASHNWGPDAEKLQSHLSTFLHREMRDRGEDLLAALRVRQLSASNSSWDWLCGVLPDLCSHGVDTVSTGSRQRVWVHRRAGFKVTAEGIVGMAG